MADIADTLKNILGDDAEEKIKSAVNSLSTLDGDKGDIDFDKGGEANDIMQLRGMIESMMTNRNDPGSNLLLSLKPYMRTERKNSIDSAVKLMGILKLINTLGK